jgi:thiol-disulfide isomerase/thioredoxin
MNYLIIENDTPENNSKITHINQHIRNKKPVVIYFYKEGCPFCERTTPEWDKLPNYLSQNKDLLVVRMNKEYYERLQSVGEKPALYPNIRYVHGSHMSTFKKEGDERNAKNLAMWIQQQKQPIHFSIQRPSKPFSIKRFHHKKPKFKKSFRKRKHHKHNKFTKRRRMYYM